jgi:HlyD family secretion protein
MDVIMERKKKNKLLLTLVVVLVLGFILLLIIMIPKLFVYTESQYEIGIVHQDTIIQSIAFEGKVDFKAQKIIQSKAPGLVEMLDVQEGDSIHKGQRLILLDTSPNLTELRNLEQQLFQLNNEKNRLLIDKDKEELSFQYNIKQKRNSLNALNETLENNKELLKQGAISIEANKQLETKINNLKDEIQFTEANYSCLLREIANKLQEIDGKIKNTTENVGIWNERIKNREIKAEFDGIILETLVKEGQMINENQACFTFQSSDEYSLKIKIPQNEINNLEVKTKVYLKFGEKRYLGKVEQISSLIKEDQGYGSYIEGYLSFIKDKPPIIMPNMNFTAEWPLRIQKNILAVERGPYISDTNQKYVFRISKDGKFAEKVAVTFGIYDDKNIQIVEGLKLGDRIIISSYNELKNQNRIRLHSTSE